LPAGFADGRSLPPSRAGLLPAPGRPAADTEEAAVWDGGVTTVLPLAGALAAGGAGVTFAAAGVGVDLAAGGVGVALVAGGVGVDLVAGGVGVDFVTIGEGVADER
jgi:hypothetical protein